MRNRLLLAVMIAIMLTGCKRTIVSRRDIPPNLVKHPKEVIYVIPTEIIGNKPCNASEVLSLPQYEKFYRSKSHTEISALENTYHPNQLITKKYRGNYNHQSKRAKGTSGIKYIVDIKTESNTDSCTIKLTPQKSFIWESGLLLPYPIPEFKEEQLYAHLKASVFTHTLEINSKYELSSIQANFKRMLQENRYMTPHLDHTTGKTFDSKYILNYKGKDIIIHIDTSPYRDGTKAIFYINLPSIEGNDHVINLDEIKTDITQKLTTIVDS